MERIRLAIDAIPDGREGGGRKRKDSLKDLAGRAPVEIKFGALTAHARGFACPHAIGARVVPRCVSHCIAPRWFGWNLASFGGTGRESDAPSFSCSSADLDNLEMNPVYNMEQSEESNAFAQEWQVAKKRQVRARRAFPPTRRRQMSCCRPFPSTVGCRFFARAPQPIARAFSLTPLCGAPRGNATGWPTRRDQQGSQDAQADCWGYGDGACSRVTQALRALPRRKKQELGLARTHLSPPHALTPNAPFSPIEIHRTHSHQELEKQTPQIDAVEEAITNRTTELRAQNKKLKTMLSDLRSPQKLCVDLILVAILLGIGAYIVQMVKPQARREQEQGARAAPRSPCRSAFLDVESAGGSRLLRTQNAPRRRLRARETTSRRRRRT